MEAKLKKGFTLIELVLVMGIFALLIGFSSVNLINTQRRATLDSSINVLLSDLNSQQVKAMTGESSGLSSPFSAGIRFSSGGYTLFRGTYNPGDPLNFSVDLDNSIVLGTAFSSSEVIFERVSGEVNNFVEGANTITLSDSQTGEMKIITVNRLGVLNVQ